MVRLTTIKPVVWARLEFIWIGIGFLGVLTLIDENRLMFQKSELDQVETWIEGDFRSITRFSDLSAHCIKYQNTGIFEQEEFDKRQLRQDMICQWTKNVKTYLDSLATQDYPRIDELPLIKIDSAETEWTYTQILDDVEQVNIKIERRDNLNQSIKVNNWGDFKQTFGLILLILAFALRFTIVTNKVRTEKKKEA